MHWIEKWLFPPTCVISGAKTLEQDLDTAFIQKWQITEPICPVCAETSPQGLVCGVCLRQPPAFYRTQVAFRFDDELRELIHQYKYQRQLHLSRLFAELLAQQLDASGVQGLVPIPLHSQRLRQRGYNQALELARVLSAELNLPILTNLTRPQPTQSQTHLNAKQRKQNLKKAFQAQPLPEEIRHIALVDDVMTTGATMQAAAESLQGAQPGLVVQAWALAKTD